MWITFRDFGEIYDAKEFVASLNGVVQVARVQPTEISSMKFTAVKALDKVQEDFITSKVEPIFRTKRNLRLATYFDSLSLGKLKETMHSNAYQCLATFRSFKLQAVLQGLVDSRVGTLQSTGQRTVGHLVAVDLWFDMLGKKRWHENVDSSKCCCNAKEIGEFFSRRLVFTKKQWYTWLRWMAW